MTTCCPGAGNTFLHKWLLQTCLQATLQAYCALNTFEQDMQVCPGLDCSTTTAEAAGMTGLMMSYTGVLLDLALQFKLKRASNG